MKPIDAYIFGILIGHIGKTRNGITLHYADICAEAGIHNLQLAQTLSRLRGIGAIHCVHLRGDMFAISMACDVAEVISERVAS